MKQFYRFINLLLLFITLCLAAVYIYFIIVTVNQGKGEGRREIEHSFYKTLLSPQWNISRASFRETLDSASAQIFVNFFQEALIENNIRHDVNIRVFNPSNEEVFNQTNNPLSFLVSRIRLSIKNRNFQKVGELEVEYSSLSRRLLAQIILLVVSLIVILIIFAATIYLINLQLKQQEKQQQATLNLIGNISHELRSPITAISLACESLRKEMPDNKLLQAIDTENRRMGLLAERVIQNLRFQQFSLEAPKKERLHIHELLTEIVQNVRITQLPSDTRLSLILNSNEDEVLGDKVLLTSVFYNLIENAIKYRDPAKPFHWIEISTLSRGITLRISIKDNGIGIPEKYIHNIFDRFFRVPTNDVHNVKGHGLGLAFVKSVIESHQGSITVRSIEGKETEFIIFLNLCPKNQKLLKQ
ncbi:MAG: HAMP domain-containing histidine kinase [Flavobacteriales bacterium]|nr:HAMP domain-containing histidine kinase [Flavobacteriales bacterium]